MKYQFECAEIKNCAYCPIIVDVGGFDGYDYRCGILPLKTDDVNIHWHNFTKPEFCPLELVTASK